MINLLISEYGTTKQTIAKQLNMSLPTFRRRLREKDFDEIYRVALLAKWGGLFND